MVQFIPEMKGEGRDAITIEQLLTHTSGFAPDFDLRERWTGYDEAIKRLYREPLRTPPGRVLSTATLTTSRWAKLCIASADMMLDEFARQNIFAPLGMRDTGFNPDVNLDPNRADRKTTRSDELPGRQRRERRAEGEQWLRGQVHDPTSFRMSGVAGHAGLFSTADDLAIFCQMLLNGGVYNGARIFSPHDHRDDDPATSRF